MRVATVPIQIVIYNDSEKSRVIKYIVEYGCLVEQSDLPCLLSVDLAPSLSYTNLKKFLDECSALEILGYQEACLAHDR